MIKRQINNSNSENNAVDLLKHIDNLALRRNEDIGKTAKRYHIDEQFCRFLKNPLWLTKDYEFKVNSITSESELKSYCTNIIEKLPVSPENKKLLLSQTISKDFAISLSALSKYSGKIGPRWLNALIKKSKDPQDLIQFTFYFTGNLQKIVDGVDYFNMEDRAAKGQKIKIPEPLNNIISKLSEIEYNLNNNFEVILQTFKSTLKKVYKSRSTFLNPNSREMNGFVVEEFMVLNTPPKNIFKNGFSKGSNIALICINPNDFFKDNTLNENCVSELGRYLDSLRGYQYIFTPCIWIIEGETKHMNRYNELSQKFRLGIVRSPETVRINKVKSFIKIAEDIHKDSK